MFFTTTLFVASKTYMFQLNIHQVRKITSIKQYSVVSKKKIRKLFMYYRRSLSTILNEKNKLQECA